MIVWRVGFEYGGVNTGLRYNPGTDTWTFTFKTNAPEARAAHTAVWTGSEMIVWGVRGEVTSEQNTAGDTIRLAIVGQPRALVTRLTPDCYTRRFGPAAK